MPSCCDDFGNCTQGRDCPIRNAKVKKKPDPDDLPITFEDEPLFDFEWAATLMRNVFAGAGFLAMIALIFYFYGWKA